MSHKPSKYQQDIYNALVTTNKNIAISATAGAGKSTTLVEAAKLIPYGKKAIFIAFNKHIVNELKKKLPHGVECMTLHSLGYRCIRNNYNSINVSPKKQINFIEPIFKQDTDQRKKWAKIYAIDKIMSLARATMTKPNTGDLNILAEKYALDIGNEEIVGTIKAMRQLQEYNEDVKHYDDFSIDFIDMIAICAIHDISLPKYDYVCVDESQDLSVLDRTFINKIVKPITGRKIICGDQHQCQPAGTKVLLYDGTEKNIEDLTLEDRVVSYNLSEGRGFKGFYKNWKTVPINMKLKSPRIFEIQKRYIEDKLIVIESDGKKSKYTFNHKCLVRFNKNKQKAHAVYLMQKGVNFRIGITPLWTRNEIGSVTHRAKQEKADKFWVLDLFKTREDAYIAEQILSIKYQIPQMIFVNNGCFSITQDKIEKFYEMFDEELTKGNAIKLLHRFNRKYEHPFWVHGRKNYISKTHMFQLEACNILSDEYMECCFFNEHIPRHKKYGIKAEMHIIQNVYTEEYKGDVYSLKIENETYVADGILTHNSIYSFRGSDLYSFTNFVKEANTIQMPLTVSYRCAKAIVREAKKIYPEIEEWPESEEGIVRKGKIEEIGEEDMVICRNTLPLIEVFLSLISNDKKAYIVGKEMEQGLLGMLASIDSSAGTDAWMEFKEREKEKVINKLKNKGIKNPLKHPQYGIFNEKIQILSLLFDKFQYVYQIEEFVKEMFEYDEEEYREGTKLITVHKSKGLECNRVFFIVEHDGKKLIPSQYAVTEEMLMVEENIRFVGTTRAKKELIYLHL